MKEKPEDFEGDSEQTMMLAPQDKLEKLHEMAEELNAMNSGIDAAEKQLEAMKSARHALRVGAMPKLMNELNMPQFTYDNMEFMLGDLVTGSFPKEPDKREIAVSLLKRYDADGLIVSCLEINFPKSEHNTAEWLFGFLRFRGYSVSLEETIHTMTYNAFGRRRLEEGEEIDFEGLGMHHSKIVKTKEITEKRRIRKVK